MEDMFAGNDFVVRWVLSLVSSKLKGLSPAEARLQRLEVLREMEKLLGEIARESGDAEALPSDRQSVSDESLANLPLTDAVYEYLKSVELPKTPQEIWAALEAAGQESTSKNPADSVKWAIRRLQEKGTDVFHVEWGKWHVKSRYTKSKLQKIAARNAGKGGRSTAAHIERTREGMEKARASGQRIGAKSKLTIEKVREFQRLRREGVIISEAMKTVGLATATYYNNKIFIEAWREGDPWPPPMVRQETAPEAPTDHKPPHMRLVK